MLPLILEHGSDSSSSAVCSGQVTTRSRPTSMVIAGTTARTLPHPPGKKRTRNYLAARRAKTLIRSRSVPCSGNYVSRTPTPASTPSPSVSTQDEDTDDPATVSVSAIIAGHARISPINEKISPPRPISLDIQANYHIKVAASATASAEANGKIDREQQTPQE